MWTGIVLSGLLLGEASLSQVNTAIIFILQMTRPKLLEVETHTQFSALT